MIIMSDKGFTLAEIALMTGGNAIGDKNLRVTSIAPPDAPKPGAICPLWEKKAVKTADPNAVLLTKRGWIPENSSGIEADDPRRALVSLLDHFAPPVRPEYPAIHETALISENVSVGVDTDIGPYCVVSERSVIGKNCTLLGHVWIGKDVSIGDNSLIEPGAVIYDRITIGKNCIIHANAVIGCEGFGFITEEKGLLRIPQIGTVTIGDDVEIGSCSSIDRGTFGATVISNGTKIDSHVKVAHNCTIGEHCIVVAQSGIAGSSKLGDWVTMAAQTGVANHAIVGDGVIAAGRAGITSDTPPGSIVSGFPAIDHKRELQQIAALRQLPELFKTVRELEKKLDRLKTE